jgi:SOS response regulatory protein OraA/RecX
VELSRRGIAAELITANLPDEAAETERCREALAGKLKNSNLPEEYKEKQKLAAFLARRGFSLDTIKSTLSI